MKLEPKKADLEDKEIREKNAKSPTFCQAKTPHLWET